MLFIALPFCLQLWFHGVDGATFEIMVLNGLNPHDLFLADWPLTELSFDTECVGVSTL